jgi:hypothetical protein
MANDLTLKVGFDIDKFQKELNKTNGMLNKWGSTVKSSLMGVAAGFSAMAVGQFALDISKLAGEAEGVKSAFDKLPNAVQVMQELKAATSGTVSELELMKRAVMADNFGISMEALPKLLEFAAIRAKQTGQSVDYLVDSIVTGIGRKSPLILDNLGISTTRLKEKFGGAALEAQSIADVAKAVGAIAEEELGKMGSMSENASTKVERLGASWDNLKVSLGGILNGTNALTGALDSLTTSVDLLASKNIGLLQKLMAIVNPAMAVAAIAEDVAKSAIDAAQAQQKQNEIIDTATVLLRDLGLDYEALMNVAGDNVNVMEIWNEMQRQAAERSAKTSTEVVKQAAAIRELTAAQQAAAKRLDNTRQQGGGGADMAGLANFSNIGNILDQLKPKFEAVRIPMVDMEAQLQKLGLVAIDVGAIMHMSLTTAFEAIGAAMGDAISGVGNFGDNIVKAFAGLAQQVGAILISLGTAALVTKKYFLKSPGLAIAAGIALVAIGKAASNSISKAASNLGGSGGASGGGGDFGGGVNQGTRLEGLGQRVQIVGEVKVSGKELNIVLANQQRADSRTKIG